MKQEIKNLADDLELKGDRRKEFVAEMMNEIAVISDNDYDRFYAIANVVMQKFS